MLQEAIDTLSQEDREREARAWKETKDEWMTEWVGEIARLWDVVGKPLDADRLAIYQRELADIPFGLLRLSISRVIRENTYSNVPPVGTIWKALRVELGNPSDVMQAIENWLEKSCNRCIIRFDNV